MAYDSPKLVVLSECLVRSRGLLSFERATTRVVVCFSEDCRTSENDTLASSTTRLLVVLTLVAACLWANKMTAVLLVESRIIFIRVKVKHFRKDMPNSLMITSRKSSIKSVFLV